MGLTPHLELYQPVPLEQGYGDHLNDNLDIIDTAIYDLQQAVDPNSYVPTGCQVIGHSFTPDSGWLLCDGSEISRTTYAALFAKIGTRYGIPADPLKFKLPDKVGRVVVGADPTIANPDYALGATGGAEEVTLDTTQIPAHKHDASAATAGDHTHTYFKTAAVGTNGSGGSYYGANSGQTDNTSSSGNHAHTISMDNTGGGLAHENRMPYIAEPWWIKT